MRGDGLDGFVAVGAGAAAAERLLRANRLADLADQLRLHIIEAGGFGIKGKRWSKAQLMQQLLPGGLSGDGMVFGADWRWRRRDFFLDLG